MRLGFLTLILIGTIFGSAYWYDQFDRVCHIPIIYRIGSVDPRFGTSNDELKRIAARAEAVWEGPLKTELFTYDEYAGIPLNLVYDERQENAEIEAELREDLNAKEGMSESVSAQYETLIAQFRNLKKQYEARVVAYETVLDAYNDEVTKWDKKGGAPKEVVDNLTVRQHELAAEQKSLEDMAKKLNALVTELNRIGARGNSLITDYYEIVREYNERFAEAEEFAQGDYTIDAIDVYQFDSEDELAIVLAHEFGHALSLDHIDGPRSIMYRSMGAQRLVDGLTEYDIAEFKRVCTDRGVVVTFFRFISSLW